MMQSKNTEEDMPRTRAAIHTSISSGRSLREGRTGKGRLPMLPEEVLAMIMQDLNLQDQLSMRVSKGMHNKLQLQCEQQIRKYVLPHGDTTTYYDLHKSCWEDDTSHVVHDLLNATRFNVASVFYGMLALTFSPAHWCVLRTVTTLKLRHCSEYDVPIIGELKQLTTLEIHFISSVERCSLEPLQSLHRLTRFVVHRGFKDVEFPHVARLTALQDLRLWDVHDPRRLLQNINKLTALRFLDISNTTNTPLQWLAADALKQFRTLQLEVLGVSNHYIGDPGLELICKHFPALTGLYVANCNITDIRPLAKLRNLEQLVIGNNPITDLAALRTLGVRVVHL